MTHRIEAVYEGGLLRPIEPLALKEHERVQVVVYAGPSRAHEIARLDGLDWKCRVRATVRHRRRAQLPPAGGNMTFADLPSGVTVFIDANILTYHFQPHPIFGPACSEFARAIKRQEVRGLPQPTYSRARAAVDDDGSVHGVWLAVCWNCAAFETASGGSTAVGPLSAMPSKKSPATASRS